MHLSEAYSTYRELCTRLHVAKYVVHFPPQIAEESLNDAYVFRYLSNLPAVARIAQESGALCGAYTLPTWGASPCSSPSPAIAHQTAAAPRAQRWSSPSKAPLFLALTPICPARRDIYISNSRPASHTTVTATARDRETPRTPRCPRRLFFTLSRRTSLELNYNGRSNFLRDDKHFSSWYHPGHSCWAGGRATPPPSCTRTPYTLTCSGPPTTGFAELTDSHTP
ncbi:hypothetical protein Efla_004558 [Eimeria flavescens]